MGEAVLQLVIGFLVGLSVTLIAVWLGLRRPRWMPGRSRNPPLDIPAPPEHLPDPLALYLRDRFNLDVYTPEDGIEIVEELISRARSQQGQASSRFLDTLLDDLKALRTTDWSANGTLGIDVLETLRVHAFADELVDYLTTRLSGGFENPPARELMRQRWPHALFRAEMVAETYIAETAAHDVVRLLALPAAILRHHLGRDGIIVDRIQLLTNVFPRDADFVATDRNQLSSQPGVRNRILSKPNGRFMNDETIIDCIFVGYTDTLGGAKRASRLIVFNPAEWS